MYVLTLRHGKEVGQVTISNELPRGLIFMRVITEMIYIENE